MLDTLTKLMGLKSYTRYLIIGLLFVLLRVCKPNGNSLIIFFDNVVSAYSFIPEYNTYLDLKQWVGIFSSKRHKKKHGF